jgi:hypothetical protein
MHYQDIRSQLRSGDLLLCSGTGWFSRLIQAATGSEWSHVGLVLRLEQLDRVMLLESVESMGVRAVPLSRYFENYEQSGAAYPGRLAVYRHEDFPAVTGGSPALARLGRFAVDRLGWPYDGQQIAELAARLTLHRLVGRDAASGAFGDHPTAADRLDGGPAVSPSYSFGQEGRSTHRVGEGSSSVGQEGSGGLRDLLPDGSLANQAYICSEYVAACYAELGIGIACGGCPYVTPGDFAADPKVEAMFE